MSQEFLKLVRQALFNQNAAERQEGEQLLEKQSQTAIEAFLLECVKGLMEGPDASLRQACGTLLKRSLKIQNPQGVLNWHVVSIVNRQNIKNALLQLLMSPEVLVRRSAADGISEICTIELPRKEWPELIQVLVQNTSNESTDVRRAAVMTLGYICEGLKRINQKDCIDQSESEKILYGICMSLKKEETDVDIKLQAVKALRDSLSFMDSQFSKKMVRDHVTTVLLENAVHEKEDIRVAALQTLIDYVKILYANFEEYGQHILLATASSIQSPHPNISIPAMEIWSAVGQSQLASDNDTKKDPSVTTTNALLALQVNLLPILIENLLKNEEDEDDEDETQLTIQESAYKAVSAIAGAVKSPCHYQITNFISNTIRDQDWKRRRAAVLCLGALAETSGNQDVRTLLVSAVHEVTNMLKDSSNRVQKSVGRVLARIAENYPEVVLLHANALQLVQSYIEALQAPPSIAIQVLQLFQHLTENLVNFPQSQIFPQYKVILQFLAATTTRQDLTNKDTQIVNLAFVGIQNIMHSLTDTSALGAFLDDFHLQFISTYQMEGWRREVMQQGLLSVMHGCITRHTRLSKNTPMNAISPQKLITYYQTVLQYFQNTQDVSSDGIYVVSALALAMKRQFTQFSQEFITKYWQHAVTKRENNETFKAAIFLVADIAKAIGSDFVQFPEILLYFQKLIVDTSIDRELKLHVYSCMADVVYGVGKQTPELASQVLQCLMLGFQACISLASSGDPELVDYSDRLKEILVPAFTCVLHAQQDNNEPFIEIMGTLPYLYEALEKLTQQALKPTVEFIRMSLNLLVDFANFYRVSKTQDTQRLLSSPLVKHLRNTLSQFIREPENAETIEYLNYVALQHGLNV